MAREAAAALCARSMASLFLPRAAAGAAGVAGASSSALAYAAATAAATSSAPATGAGAAREMSAAAAAAAATAPTSGLVSLPPLPYDYSALEPVISAEIMHLHHSKHHQAYVTNFNKAVEALEAAKEKADAEAIAALTKALKFNGGGHVNHAIFWKNLAPVQEGGGAPPTGALAEQIKRQWGSLDSFVGKFSAAAVGVEGSGWAWLGLHPDTKVLNIVTTQNQDPCITTGHIPLLGIDVWEHAYYLQYKNVRPDYLKNVWKVVNWRDVAERFDKAA